MPEYLPTLDGPDLFAWPDIEPRLIGRSLLLGNGASIAVSESFRYDSLFAIASSPQVADPLTDADRNLFEGFGTTNFELILGGLKVARLVAVATGLDVDVIRARYDSIQRALFEAVGPTHVSWVQAAAHSLGPIRAELRRHNYVFSTNYDLLVYWAIMFEHDHGEGFKDYFWNAENRFDQANADTNGGATRVLYLHGGLHLRHDPRGVTRKQVAVGQSLLDHFPTAFDEPETPLLISEGSSVDKLASISRSDYLSFAFQKLVDHRGPLVVFGQSLDPTDAHITRAINSWQRPWREPLVAISVMRGPDDLVRQTKTQLANRLPYADLWFFDASTHPLGSAGVRVA